MTVSPANFNTFTELKNYIHEKLCELEQLDAKSFPLSQQSLKQRGDQLCGYLFSISGPRSVVFNAVLETVNNVIHFYNSSGERVVSESISNVPPLDH